MTTLQAIALGAMLAWAPSLIILAASLWDVRELEGLEQPGNLPNSVRHWGFVSSRRSLSCARNHLTDPGPDLGC